MKNPVMEKRYRQMKAYHLQRPWRLTEGVFIPHSYTESNPISWWDDVGFILNKRRILIIWQHPRMVYDDHIEAMARQLLPYPAELNHVDLFTGSEKQYKRVGKSRKKVVSFRMGSFFEKDNNYYHQLNNLEEKMRTEGIDLTIKPSMKIEIHSWCRLVELCVPVEVRNVDGVKALIALTKKLIKRETTLDQLFPDYEYTKQAWLAEASLRKPQAVLAHQLNSNSNF